MAGPLRLEFAGTRDHETARGNERRSIFLATPTPTAAVSDCR
jgi:hypothetical protein